MPTMKVIDIGRVNVTELPRKIPKTITDPMDRRRKKIDRGLYRLFWAVRHLKPGERMRILAMWGISPMSR